MCLFQNARQLIRPTLNAAAGEGKKIDEGAMMPPLESNIKSSPMAVADPPEMQSLTPATGKEPSDIPTNNRNSFETVMKIKSSERHDHCPSSSAAARAGRAPPWFIPSQWGLV
jgi:hypothetical protein